MKKAHVLLFDGYADWEIGNVLAEIRRLGQKEVISVGFTQEPVTSMGGLNVTPDMALADVRPKEVLILILPGGYLWEGEYPQNLIDPLVRQLQDQQVPVAGICAATTALARSGILFGKKHTSNSIKYLSDRVADYSGHNDYMDQPAVRDGHVITASGLAAVEFTMEILSELDLATPEMRTLWFEAFKHGNYPEDH